MDEFLEIALTVARKAAQFVHSGWRTRPEVEHKGQVDLVTKFDRESEQIVRTALAAATPFPVVGEETGGDHSGPEPVWYVDPIDGTTNFVHGHPFYCVSIGLLQAGRPILGCVVAPALATEWTGIVGGVATRNGEVCRVSQSTKLGESLLATGFPYDRKLSPENNFDAFVAIKKQCQAVRRCGSAAIDFCLVADGTYDGYWERKLAPWDVAAGSAIVLAAGGTVSDYDGNEESDVRRGQILATNGLIHKGLVEALAVVHRTIPPSSL